MAECSSSKFYCQTCQIDCHFSSKYQRHLSSASHRRLEEILNIETPADGIGSTCNQPPPGEPRSSYCFNSGDLYVFLLQATDTLCTEDLADPLSSHVYCDSDVRSNLA